MQQWLTTRKGDCEDDEEEEEVLFSSLAVLDPTVGHTTDVLSPFIPFLCHSDWLFHGQNRKKKKTFQNTKKIEKTDRRSGKKQSKGTAWCSCRLSVAPTATCHSHRHIRRRHFQSCCRHCGLRWYSHSDGWGYNSPALKSGLGSLPWSSWRVYHREYVHLPPPTQHKSNLLQVSHTGWAKKILKSVNIWQSCMQERGCLMHFARLANTLLNDGESARDSHVLACNFAKY